MKGIYDILKSCGVEVPEEAKESFEKELNANYKSIAEVTKKDATITELRGQLKTATDGLKAFDGVNVDDLKGPFPRRKAETQRQSRPCWTWTR